ncbi:hypothetical protein AX15_005105 [Amanita polypyramis BW_CC]|nr:hypothetical protein AX15_005105 [Amanita polypyramis BW_CC]
MGPIDSVKIFSGKFQWLPCDVDVSGNQPKIVSYVNNLHPQRHKDLYSVIEKIIDCAIPLWNTTLTKLKTPKHYFNPRVSYTEAFRKNGDNEMPEWKADMDEDDYDDRFGAWLDMEARQPEVGAFQPLSYVLQSDGTPPEDYSADLKRDYGDRGLQIIVKLANIHLTPEKPEYGGGSWHVEGMMNEHICATALYYYDSENITPSELAFRQFSDAEEANEINYDQQYHRWMLDVFGCDPEGPPIQDVGSVETRESRLLTFPNILQHQVQPFKLADLTKPGHRKILALFLVDPNTRIISTANVPCQRHDWWCESIKEKNTALGRLPLELQDKVFSDVEEFPMKMETAKELRLDLMEERKKLIISHDNFVKEVSFSLCQH